MKRKEIFILDTGFPEVNIKVKISKDIGTHIEGLTRTHSYLPGKTSMAAHEV